MHATIHIWTVVEDLLTMIGHIDHHSILVDEPLCDNSHNGVIIAQRVVIMRQYLFLLV